jgi:manganese/zinc/iron transport system permease protein
MVEVIRADAQAGYNPTVVLIGVTPLGAAGGVVGTFAVLRRRALMSDALSLATLGASASLPRRAARGGRA